MSVEALVRELVDCVALIACCGEAVRLAPGPGGNCIVNDRVLACLYAPVVDAALVGRFPLRDVLSGAPLPAALVLLQVDEGSRSPRARTVGDVLRSDRISSGSLDLTDAPTRSPHGAVTIRADDIYFCVPSDLRPGLSESSSSDARARICDLLPGVFA